MEERNAEFRREDTEFRRDLQYSSAKFFDTNNFKKITRLPREGSRVKKIA